MSRILEGRGASDEDRTLAAAMDRLKTNGEKSEEWSRLVEDRGFPHSATGRAQRTVVC